MVDIRSCRIASVCKVRIGCPDMLKIRAVPATGLSNPPKRLPINPDGLLHYHKFGVKTIEGKGMI